MTKSIDINLLFAIFFFFLYNTTNEVFFHGFSQQMWPNPHETSYLVTFTKEILNGKLRFLRSIVKNATLLKLTLLHGC